MTCKKEENNLKRVRKEKFGKRILLYVLVIVLFFLGNAYSILRQDLKLSGTITIPAKEVPPEPTIPLSATVIQVKQFKEGYKLDFSVTNNSGADVSGWTAIISVPNVTDLFNINGGNVINDYCTVDVQKGTITVKMPADVLKYGTITNGTTITVEFGEIGANTATIIDCYSGSKPSVNSLMAFASKESFNEKIENISLDNIEITNLDNVKYSNSDLELDIEFNENIETNKYVTIAVLKVTNKTNKKINNLAFQLDYKDANNYFSKIETNSLKQTLNSTNSSSYQLLDFDFINPNSYKIFQISNFISEQRFTGFSISNVKYNFELEEIVSNKTSQNVIEK